MILQVSQRAHEERERKSGVQVCDYHFPIQVTTLIRVVRYKKKMNTQHRTRLHREEKSAAAYTRKRMCKKLYFGT
jgi:hypothetical protein